MTKVSILTPCYNVKSEYLSQCFDSLLSQTLKEIEIICIDDGSTDDTGRRLDAYAKRDARIKVIHKPNSGYGDSMNLGLSHCKGEYVGIVEPDDWVEPDMFEVLYRTAEKNKLDLAHCCHFESRRGQKEIAVLDDWIPKNVVLNPLIDKSVFMLAPAIWCSLVRRQILHENGIKFLPTPGASFQDTSYAFKLRACARRFMFIDRCLHHYRINEGSSVSSVNSEQKAFCVCLEYDEIFKFAKRNSENFRQLKTILPVMENGCYIWNINHLRGELRYCFVKKWQQELLDRIDAGEIDLVALPSAERNLLENIAYSADEWFDKQYPKERTVAPAAYRKKISVVITMYKNAATIEKAIRSVTNQGYSNLEIICVDDVSPDACAKIAQRVAKHDKRVKVIKRKENGGRSACRNTGIDAATGDSIMFVDGDDELLPHAIESLAAAFDNHVDAVFSSCRCAYEGGPELYGHYPASDAVYYTIPGTDRHQISKHEIFKLHCSTSAKLFRLKHIKDAQLRFPVGYLFEDSLFTWSYFSLFRKVSFLSKPVYLYWRHKSSIMTDLLDKPENKAIQHISVLRRYLEFLDDRKILKSFSVQLPALVEAIFWFSFDQCAKWEQAEAVAVAAKMLHEFKINCTSDVLKRIFNGELNTFFLEDKKTTCPAEDRLQPKVDERYAHRIVKVALRIDEATRKAFPLGDTKLRRFARFVWDRTLGKFE